MALSLMLKGVIIGVAAIIPGVSGSLFAVIVGVYDELILSISNFRKEPKKHLSFLLPITAGIIIGVLLAANPILEVCHRYPLYSYCFFVGIMVAGVWEPIVKSKTLSKRRFNEILLCVICFLLVVILRIAAHLSGAGDLVSMPQISSLLDVIALFCVGFISVGVMALPGVSGSITLMVLGFYGTIYKAAGSPARLIKAIIEGEKSSILSALDGTAMLIPFFLGGVVGFFVCSKLISRVIHSHKNYINSAVIGFILGSVATLIFDAILPEVNNFSGDGFVMWLLILGFVLSGAFLTFAMPCDKH